MSLAMATCHPDRSVHSRGLCTPCYQRWYYHREHPGAGSYYHEDEPAAPRRTAAATQRAKRPAPRAPGLQRIMTIVPERCPTCLMPVGVEGRRIFCLNGHDWFRPI